MVVLSFLNAKKSDTIHDKYKNMHLRIIYLDMSNSFDIYSFTKSKSNNNRYYCLNIKY